MNFNRKEVKIQSDIKESTRGTPIEIKYDIDNLVELLYPNNQIRNIKYVMDKRWPNIKRSQSF